MTFGGIVFTPHYLSAFCPHSRAWQELVLFHCRIVVQRMTHPFCCGWVFVLFQVLGLS